MSMVRLDVSDFDDTDLGGEVRAAFRAGHTIVMLYDGTVQDYRANGWIDGTHGLWRVECPREHMWLSARSEGALVQRTCPTCDLVGTPVG